MAQDPLPSSTPAPARTGGTPLLVALLVGVVALIALLLFVLPPAGGPIYTDLPPVEGEGSGDLSTLLGLLPLTAIAILLVLLGTFVIPALIRRHEAGTLDPARAIAAADRLRGRLRLTPLLPALRVASFAVGALLTAVSVVFTVPELLTLLTDAPAPSPDPGPIDPTSGGGGIDPASLLAMAAGVVIFGGLLLFVLPSLKLRLPTRSMRPTASAVSDHAPSVFVARTELPPEIAALFPAPPRLPTRWDRFAEMLIAVLRRIVGGVTALRRVGAVILRGSVRFTVRTAEAMARLVRRAAFALVALAQLFSRAVIRALQAGGRLSVRLFTATVSALRWSIRSVLHVVRQMIRGVVVTLRTLLYGAATVLHRVVIGLQQAARSLGRAVTTVVVWIIASIGAALLRTKTLIVATVRALIVLLVLFGHAIILAAVALFLIGLAALDLLAQTLVSIVIATGRSLWWIARVSGRVLGILARLTAALPSHLLRSSIRTVRGVWQHIRTVGHRSRRLIDGRRRPAEGGPMTTPATILVVALAPQSGKSTVAAEASRLLGSPWINSSAVIAERLEQRLGLPKGRIAEARAVDHEAYRPALIEEGNRMSAEGTSPGVECVRRGYRVIDGIRRREELEAAVAEVRLRGGLPIVICVRRPHAPALADNTESAALAAQADVIIDNDGALSRLRRRTASVLRRHRAL